jgi:DNA ligase-associated metallophosphoesterase
MNAWARLASPAHDLAADGAGLRMTVSGAAVTFRASGALWIEAERTLVIADLHLEKGSAYAARGQMLPPYDSRESLARLAAEVEALAPRRVVMLGDAFHDVRAGERLAPDDAAAIGALAIGRTLVWVTGNHDPEPPRDLPGEAADEMPLAGLILRHEPAMGAAPGEASGHLHPCARIAAGGRSVRRRCFVTDGERLILPAFGAYAGGLNIRDAAFSGLFARAPLAIVLGPRRTHAVGWRSTRPD